MFDAALPFQENWLKLGQKTVRKIAV